MTAGTSDPGLLAEWKFGDAVRFKPGWAYPSIEHRDELFIFIKYAEFPTFDFAALPVVGPSAVIIENAITGQYHLVEPGNIIRAW